MYNSYAQQLIELERRRRERRYGHLARLSQLKWIVLCSFVTYIVCTYYLWKHPLPLSHVWIDDVLVEVLEHNSLEYVQRFFLWLSLLSGMAFMLYYTFCNTNNESNTVNGSWRCNDNLANRTGSDMYCNEWNKGNAHGPQGKRDDSSKWEQHLPLRSEEAKVASSKFVASASSLRPSSRVVEPTYLYKTELINGYSNNKNISKVNFTTMSDSKMFNNTNINVDNSECRHSPLDEEHLHCGQAQSTRYWNKVEDVGKTAESIRTVEDLNKFLRENEKSNCDYKIKSNKNCSNACINSKMRENDNFNAYRNDCFSEFASVQANQQPEKIRRYDREEKRQNGCRFMETDKVHDVNKAKGNSYWEGSADAYNVFTNNNNNNNNNSSNDIYWANDIQRNNYTNVKSSNSNAFTTSTTFESEMEHKIKQQWTELNIIHPELAIIRVREWINEICEKLVKEIDESTKWFATHQISVFDATHSLKETVTVDTLVPAAPTMAVNNAFANNTSTLNVNSTWGNNVQTQFQQQCQRMIKTKRIALTEENNRIRQLIQSQQRQLQQFQPNLFTSEVQSREYNEMIMRYNQRLSMEDVLDITNTFTTTSTLTNRELNEQRRYILGRLRKFARERTLVSYQGSLDAEEEYNNGGNANAQYEEFSHKIFKRNRSCHLPCDAHILVHILRMCVNGLSPLITFNYSNYTNSYPSAKSSSLALYVGDVGAPYFYIRHRCNLASVRYEHETERMYVTHQRTNSLFEALAIIIAITHLHYDDNYVDGQNEFNLKKTGLIRIVSTMSEYCKTDEYIQNCRLPE